MGELRTQNFIQYNTVTEVQPYVKSVRPEVRLHMLHQCTGYMKQKWPTPWLERWTHPPQFRIYLLRIMKVKI